MVAKGEGKAAGTVTVDIGQWETIEVEGGENCEVSTRVTVRMPEDGYPIRQCSSPSSSSISCSLPTIAARIVPPSTPTSESGLYWGYQVRLADSLAAVFSESPYAAEGGYDVSIGTSERGTPVEGILNDVEPFR